MRAQRSFWHSDPIASGDKARFRVANRAGAGPVSSAAFATPVLKQASRHSTRCDGRKGLRRPTRRGRNASWFIPVRNAEIVACPQLPTTLPTLDEVAARDGVALEDSVPRILEVTARPVQAGHVFSLRADREGLNRATLFERLLEGWRAQGYALAALEDCLEDVNLARLPRHNIVEGALPGRTSPVALQGKEFLA